MLFYFQHNLASYLNQSWKIRWRNLAKDNIAIVACLSGEFLMVLFSVKKISKNDIAIALINVSRQKKN